MNPVRFLVARPQFAAMRSLVHAAYGAGEVALGLAPRRFGDYSVIAFRKLRTSISGAGPAAPIAEEL